MWIYEQVSGRMFRPDLTLLATGYSGHERGKNNPAMEHVANVGPIPYGRYTIGPAFDHPHKGPLVMRLTPDAGDEMFGRAGFLIHGDSIHDPGDASEGCIILPHPARQEIASSPDRRLQVVAHIVQEQKA